MPSFDVVSELDLAEAENAVQNVMREIGTRYDFKGSQSKVEIKEGVLTLFADDDMKLRQVHEILQGQYAKTWDRTGFFRLPKGRARRRSVRQANRSFKTRDRQRACKGFSKENQSGKI